MKKELVTFVTRFRCEEGIPMRKIDEIGRRYPSLDLAALRILTQIDATPGMSIREIADILQLDRKFVQDSVVQMQSRGLINNDKNLADKRKRSLDLTSSGENVAEYFEQLTMRNEK